MKVAYIFPPPWDPKHPPYTLALFAGITRANDHEFFGFDLNVDLYNAASQEDKLLWNGECAFRWITESDRIVERYAEYLNKYIADMLRLDAPLYAIYVAGVSKNFSFWLSRTIKSHNPKCRVILGGPQCFPAYDGMKILCEPSVDAICTGEADLIWKLVLDNFANNSNFHIKVPGIAYKMRDGTIMGGGVPELVTDLDAIPFADYSSVDLSKYSGFRLATMASRGCINTCAFCSEKPNFLKYRYRSAENVLEEIKTHLTVLQQEGHIGKNKQSVFGSILGRLIWVAIQSKSIGSGKIYSFLKRIYRSAINRSQTGKHGGAMGVIVCAAVKVKQQQIPYMAFNDSLINGIPRELSKFCDLVIDSGIKFNWGGMGLLRKEMNPELLAKMHKAGCYNISWGLETGSQDVIGLMQKRLYTMDLAKAIISNTYKSGIKQNCSLIVGFPGETEEMFEETIQFVREFSKYFDSMSAQPMMIVRNSTVYDHCEDFDIDKENSDKYLEWETRDGKLDYATRLKRLNKLESLLNNKLIVTEHE